MGLGRLFDFNQLILFGLALLLVASVFAGASWIALDRNQVRVERVLPDLQVLIETPFAYPDVFMRLAQVLPQLQANEVPVERLRGAAEELQRAWLAGRSLRTAQRELAAQLDGVARSAELRSSDAYRRKAERLRQLVTMQLGMLLLLAIGVGTLRKRRKALSARLTGASPLGTNLDSLLFNNVPVPLVLSDARARIVDVNEAFEAMTGYDREECLGRNADFNLSGQQDRRFFRDMRERLVREGRYVGELWLRHRNGEAFADKITRLAVRDGADRIAGHLTISTDPTKSDASKRLMLWQAHHDPLTKLPNRNLIEERLAQAVVNSAWPCALLSIDLDRFKHLNDSVGPAQGDQVLIAAAHRLAMCACETDTVARIGADHFVLLLGNGSGYEEAEAVARNVVREFRAPFHIMDRDLFVSASVGIALFPRDGDAAGDLLQRADAARAQVKAAGGDNLGFYQPEINTRAARRLEVETQLRSAIARDQFQLHLQPILRLERAEIAGAEALLRWEHPDLGFVSPGEFIPIAEHARLIGDIGVWVVEEAGRVLDHWSEQGLGDLRLSLNVSAAQIADASSTERLLQALDGIDRSRITVELTETALIADATGARAFLTSLAQRGCAVALDDFGTGFSSLGYLRDYDFDVLKVDKVFVDRLSDERDRSLLRSILALGRALGMRCVAEGVETELQRDQLLAMNCDYLQGYWFARPLPLPAFVQFVRDHNALS